MKIEKFDELLNNYNSRLNKISKDDITYKINLENSTKIFFKKINKIDKNRIYFYFQNINKENINKNEIQRDALDYLILLTIKNKPIIDLLENFFPEYLENESTPKSSWIIMHWLQVFISFFIKTKPKLRNLIEAKRILNVLRDLKDRLSNPKNDLFNIDNVELERESYNALSLIREKIFEDKVRPLIYRSLDEEDFIKVWEASYKTKLYNESNITISDKCKENADIDILLKYLEYRIKALLDSNEKKILLKELTSLKYLVYHEKFSLFEETVNVLKNSIKKKLIYNNAFKIMGIYNLIEGIKQRLKLICIDNNDASFDGSKHLTKFVQLINLSIDKIQFYYECHRKNLDKQYEFCFENSTNFYSILNHLETLLYTNKNLFFHFTNQKFDNAAYASLSTALGNLTKLAKELENCALNIDPKPLKVDMIKLSQFILNEVLFLSTELSKEMENAPVIFYSDEESAVGARENEADSEWDDDGSDVSDTLSLDAEQHPQGLGEESPLTNLDYHSDSGISDVEEPGPSHQTLSNYPPASLFWKTPINGSTTTNPESISQLILVN